MFAILIHIRPLDLRTNTRVDVRIGSTPGPTFQRLGGYVWESAMKRRPKWSIELFALDMAAGTRIATAEFDLALGEIQEVADVRSLYWTGAPVTIYRADALQWPATVEFAGVVREPRRDIDEDVLTLACNVSAADAEKPLLTAEFDGGGGLGGEPEKRTTLKPAGFGTCFNIKPVFYDSVRNMFMLDGYGNLLGIDWLGEGLSSLGPAFANYPTEAALAAALDAGAVPPGRWATCIANGVGGLGAPPEGVITCHARFGFGMTGALMRRALITHAGIDAARVDTASFNALDAAMPYPIHYWTDEQRTVKDLNEALAAGCNASPIVTFQNRFAVVRPFGGPQIGTFKRRGFSEPAVTDWKTNDAVTPYWRVRARAVRPVDVLTFEEVNFEDDLVDRGLFNINTVYRSGNIVWLRNKSQWLYDNDVPTKGNTPPDGTAGNTYWTLLAPAPDAADLRYQDGTTIEAVQPEEANAQITRVITLSQPEVSFILDGLGNLQNGQVPFTMRASVTAANYDVTQSASWSIVASAGITAEINNTPGNPLRGQIRILGVTQAGKIDVMAMSGNVALTTSIKVNTKGGLADKSSAGRNEISPGSVIGVRSYAAAGDVVVNATEITLFETPFFWIGDELFGKATANISFLHDASTVKDAGWQVRIYVDKGAGYGAAVRDQTQGVRTGGGDTRWAIPTTLPVTIESTTQVRIKVTAQAVAFGGGSGAVPGATARYTRIDILTGAR
jgi:hypothetical protein